MRLPAALAAVVVAVTGFGSVALATADDDQAMADAAIAAFTERVTAQGWVSEGATELDEEAVDEDIFAECEAEFASVDAVFTGQFEGETAQAYSDQFTFAPEGTQPATTDAFDLSTDDEGEFIVAFVVSVDEDHVDELDTLVGLVGSPELVECSEQSIDEQMAPDSSAATEFSLPEDMLQIAVDNEADLGIGEASASLSISFEAAFFGEPITFDTTLLFARVDRTLVGVLTGHTGSSEPVSGFDPLAELTALVEDVGA